MRIRWRLGAIGMLIVAFAGLTGSPATAVEPTIVRIPIELTLVDNTCPFPTLDHFEGQIIQITYFDDAGSAIRRDSHIIVHITVTNPETGTTLTGQEAALFRRDLVEGTLERIGLFVVVTLPGSGFVLLEAGRVVFDASGNVTFEAGVHQLVTGDVGEYCAALS